MEWKRISLTVGSIFELELGSTAKGEDYSVLCLAECIYNVKMGEEEVIAALVFLDEVTLCLSPTRSSLTCRQSSVSSMR